MAPAFSSPRQSAAFALLLATLIALPALIARTGLLHRSDVYPAIPWVYGPSPWIQQKIFKETGDADVVFMGSSLIWNGVNTPYVQQELSNHLGRKAEVFTLGWPWPGLDALYVIGRDLLEHRHVRMLVIHDSGGIEMPHLYSSRWFRMGENSEALAGLPALDQARLYGGAVLGMPRTLLSMVRPNLLDDPLQARENFWSTYYRSPNLARNLGSLRARLLFFLDPAFVSVEADGTATPDDVVVYSPDTQDRFLFPDRPVSAYQLHFARKLAQLCEEKGTKLVILNMPIYVPNHRKVVVGSSELKPELLGAPVDLVGLPPHWMFAGIPYSEWRLYFYDYEHLNENGQKLFTRLIMPTLLNLYDSSRKH